MLPQAELQLAPILCKGCKYSRHSFQACSQEELRCELWRALGPGGLRRRRRTAEEWLVSSPNRRRRTQARHPLTMPRVTGTHGVASKAVGARDGCCRVAG